MKGDTRQTGLQPLVNQGLVIYDATRSYLWPGDTSLAVSVVHLAKGRVATRIEGNLLDGEPAGAINSRLRPKPERPDPRPLRANAGMSYQDSIVLGLGFTLTPEEREELVARNSRNAERIFPYIGGQEVNTSPTQSHHRFVISFGDIESGSGRAMV